MNEMKKLVKNVERNWRKNIENNSSVYVENKKNTKKFKDATKVLLSSINTFT
jgi:hypothetical protein